MQSNKRQKGPASDSYSYYSSAGQQLKGAGRAAAVQLSEKRRNPSITDVDYLVMRNRVPILARWVRHLSISPETVLDVGGRLQPYRSFFPEDCQYIAIDVVMEGLVDIVGDAECLPVESGSCDTVICTQVLSYVQDPARVLAEFYRVLKPGGTLLLTLPAFFPQFHDEKWRFTRDGIESLLANFTVCDIVPECYSLAGLARSLNNLMHSNIENYRIARLASKSTIPLINLFGILGDRLGRRNEQCASNYCARAVKPDAPIINSAA